MKLLRVAKTTTFLLALLLSLVGCFTKSEAQAFPIYVDSRLTDGYYFWVLKDSYIPPYGVYVKDGSVLGDHSDDDYGCIGRGCTETLDPKNNQYIFVNERQLERITPDGKRVVLTRYKER